MRKPFYCYQIHFSYAGFCAIFVTERYCLTDNIASGKEGLDLLVQMEIHGENQSTKKSSVPIADIS